MAASSNQKRAAERAKFRQKLVSHINTRLNLEILPAQVRLRPRRQDPYQWSVKDTCLSTLLKAKDISNATIGDFDKISKALDTGKIQAIIPQEENLSDEDQYRPLVSEETAIIEKLEGEKQDYLRSLKIFESDKERELQELRRQWDGERRQLQQTISEIQRERDSEILKSRTLIEEVLPLLGKITSQISGLSDKSNTIRNKAGTE
ncbi:hypothetical protein BJY01DRAFT_254485 [Aspergillus pseudoustus]|uniref:Uncharacterized protein n=1 Tax=Aspergillus pseudoustus TaxID=1810923 RepID=A0ABR4IVV0_9EURO